MPTGYTADVANGTVTEFRDFALRCARGFGAFVHMRDDPSDAPLRPDEPSNYYADELPKAQAEVARLNGLSEEQQRDEWQAWWTDEQAGYRRRVAESSETRKRYQAMITAVLEWQPPSPEHAEFKTFMVEQLKSSIGFDCHEWDPPERLDLGTWSSGRLADARRDLEYLRAEGKKDRERVESRNRWAQQLFDSLNGKATAQ